MNTLFFSYKNMISRSEPQKGIATNKITIMFLNFGKSEPQHSYKHGFYKKKKVYMIMLHLISFVAKRNRQPCVQLCCAWCQSMPGVAYQVLCRCAY